MQFLPHRKDPLVTSVSLSVRNLDLTKMSVVGSSESNKRCRLKDVVASWGRRKDFKMFLYDT